MTVTAKLPGTPYRGGRINRSLTLCPLQLRTAPDANVADATAEALDNPVASGMEVVVDITALEGGAVGLTVAVGFLDRASGKTINLLTSNVLSAVATTRLIVHPSVTPAANTKVAAFLPSNPVVTVGHGDDKDVTYAVGVHFY